MLRAAPGPLPGAIPDALGHVPARALAGLSRELAMLLDDSCPWPSGKKPPAELVISATDRLELRSGHAARLLSQIPPTPMRAGHLSFRPFQSKASVLC